MAFLRIKANGNPIDTEIALVDADGTRLGALEIEAFEVTMDANKPGAQTQIVLRPPRVGDEVLIEIPISAAGAATIVGTVGEAVVSTRLRKPRAAASHVRRLLELMDDGAQHELACLGIDPNR